MLSRRGMLGLAAASTIAAAPDRMVGPQVGDRLVAVDDATRTPLPGAAIAAGAPPVRAWPLDPASGALRDGTRFNEVLVLRLPDRPMAAFSAICQHAACIVSDWLPRERLLRCPCHGSEYDPARRGAVVAGPAPAPLPTLPVRVTDGLLTVAGPFSARVGGHTGRTD